MTFIVGLTKRIEQCNVLIASFEHVIWFLFDVNGQVEFDEN